ncbi:SufB/SufD family protein [Eggerthella lenta]|uniref:SufB/SufD family protein n=1 Tax=Eggerthella lenta TaxID=84112 RepID=UPI00232F3237|nr:SufD family Fe-S cluster assembly protein [Eggerthella lenta]MDB1776989.1 SufD family Fe-S cluster assembly protein [Eggerthella lenta]MDB1784384.1 SufD family Fe-S cluster assembly protein [Eggerthella lenta]MDB1790270.1 SufD family Fe-S cluster assembly protein [Eggerthella lenta]
MGTLTIEHANAMPAPTWHRLHVNDVDIELPSGLAAAQQVEVSCEEGLWGEADAFDRALLSLADPAPMAAQGLRDQPAACAAVPSSVAADDLGDIRDTRAADTGGAPVEPASAPTSAAHQVDDQATLAAAMEDGTAAEGGAASEEGAAMEGLDAPALSAYQLQALENRYLSPADVFTTGMGDEAREYLEFVAGEPVVLATRPDERTCATVRVEGVDGAANAAAVDVVAAPGSSLSLAVALDSPAPGAGVVGVRLRVFAGADARVDVAVTQTLDDGWIALDDAGIVLDERARVQVRHTVLGAGRAYTGLDADLRGDDARLDIDTRYLGHASQQRDFNYVAHQRGRRTVCNLDANGVLEGESEKTLRGTIELVHGCKGSVGSEQETVLLADERVANRTVPVILCDEDDVAGNHGATIGHVRPEQLFYLASRGISPDDAERLFITASFEEAAINAPDQRTRASVTRLAAARGIKIEEAVA